MGVGIIVPVDEPIDPVNQMSVAEKKARSHICIDPSLGTFTVSLIMLSSEIFWKRLHHALEGLGGIHRIADNVIIWGRIDEEHNAHIAPSSSAVSKRVSP